MSTETNEIDGTQEDNRPKTRQEENWLWMTVLQVPWHHANKIEDPADRYFLVDKALEVQGYLQEENRKQQEAFMQQMAAGQTPPDSNLLTPPEPQIITP